MTVPEDDAAWLQLIREGMPPFWRSIAGAEPVVGAALEAAAAPGPLVVSPAGTVGGMVTALGMAMVA